MRYLTQPECTHCCFQAAVIDTQRPLPPSGHPEPMCECYDPADAEAIAAALNARADSEIIYLCGSCGEVDASHEALPPTFRLLVRRRL